MPHLSFHLLAFLSLCGIVCVVASVFVVKLYDRSYFLRSRAKYLLSLASTFAFIIAWYAQYWDLSLESLLSFALLVIFLILFFAMALLDYKYFALPNKLLAVFFFLCIAITYFLGTQPLEDSLSTVGLFFLLKLCMESLSQKPMLGEADIVVLGGIGAVFGIFGCLKIVFLGSCISLACVVFHALKNNQSLRDTKIAFVSYLFLGTLGFILIESIFREFYV